MTDKSLLGVEEARAAVLTGIHPTAAIESVGLAGALGRTLARDLAARLTQPPVTVSAMDGYAVRALDLARIPIGLRLIGESAAGRGFSGSVGPGECARIFTGAPLPSGADAVLPQEDAAATGATVTVTRRVGPGAFVRNRGLDFAEGDRLLSAGTLLGPIEIALAAAMNHADVPVVRRPRVALLATGDELVPPGPPPGPGMIVASNAFAIAALVEDAGGEPLDLGIARDELACVEAGIEAAENARADVLVTLGGASVGDYDLVKPALARRGAALHFWRIAMRPGRPLIHGTLGAMTILGLPGNPVAAVVTGILFLVPLVRALSGSTVAAALPTEPALLGRALGANDARQDFMRATLVEGETGLPVATPFEAQDSSLLRVLAAADCLVIRAPRAPAAEPGDPCRILRLRGRIPSHAEPGGGQASD